MGNFICYINVNSMKVNINTIKYDKTPKCLGIYHAL